VVLVAGAMWWLGLPGSSSVATVPETTGTAVPDTAPHGGSSLTANLYFTPSDHTGECDEVGAVARAITVDDEPAAAAALTALTAGPNPAEREEGWASWFSDETASMVRSVRVDGGTASVDLSGDLPSIVPGAASGCGAMQLFAQMDATAKQFPDVARTVYSLDGDVDAFYAWLKMDTPDLDLDWGGAAVEPPNSGKVHADGYQAFVDEHQPSWAYVPEEAAIALLGQSIQGDPPVTIESEPGQGDQTTVNVSREVPGMRAIRRYTLTFDPPTSGPLVLVDAQVRWWCQDPQRGSTDQRPCS